MKPLMLFALALATFSLSNPADRVLAHDCDKHDCDKVAVRHDCDKHDCDKVAVRHDCDKHDCDK